MAHSRRQRGLLKYGLNCLGRNRADVLGAIEDAGFRAVDVVRPGTFGDLHGDDLSEEDLFVCEKRSADAVGA